MTLTANSRRVRTFWSMWYDIIATCNEFINPSPRAGTENAPFYAYRGIAYWHLANFYQATYKGNESKMAVPLMLKDTDINLCNTVQEVYDQVIKDLTIGVNFGATTKDIRTDMDESMLAATYLAKAYAHMEDWAKVGKLSLIATEGGYRHRSLLSNVLECY